MLQRALIISSVVDLKEEEYNHIYIKIHTDSIRGVSRMGL